MNIKKPFIILISIVVLIGAGYFWWQSMSFSKEVLKLEILGPSEVTVGESMEYVVRFKNNGNIRLENPELIFEYPDGSITKLEKQVLFDSEKLGGNIYSGQERTFKFDARLLGEQGDIKIAKATLSFKPKDLNTRNEVYTEFLTTISSVPIDLELNLPSQIGSADKAFSFTVDYNSEVSYTLEDLSIFMTYPNDFEYLYSNPNALDENQWDLDRLEQFKSGRIDVSGIMNSNAKDSAFTARIGIWNNNEFIVLKEVVKWLEVVSPSLYVTQKINNDYNFTAKQGDTLHYEIVFRNMGDEPLSDLVLVSKLEGTLFDFDSLNVTDAKYTKGDSSILFESSDFDKLKYLDVDETGTVDFWITLKDDFQMRSLSQINQKLKNKVSVGQTREEFITKVATNISARQYVDTSNSFFESSGPYPLEVNKTSKITIVWEALSDFDDVGGAFMRAIVPENGTFVEHEEYEEMGLTFDENTSELVWDIGNIPAGTGHTTSSLKVAFQIIVSPQIVVPVGVMVTGPAHITGLDEWTESDVSYKSESLKVEIKGGNIAE